MTDREKELWEKAAANARKVWGDMQTAGKQARRFEVLVRALLKAKAEAMEEAQDLFPQRCNRVAECAKSYRRAAAQGGRE